MKKPTAAQYRQAEIDTMSRHLPHTYPCGKCAWPVLDGHVCGYCGDSCPFRDKNDREVRDWK
jgi:ribosomal protein L32